MPIIIPAPLQNLPVPASALDPLSGSSGQTNPVINKRLDCFLWFDAGTPNCGLSVGNGQQGSWSINNVADCSTRPRLSMSTKFITATEPVGLQPGVTLAERQAFLDEWQNTVLPTFNTNTNQIVLATGPGTTLPTGYTTNGREATKTLGAITYRISPSFSAKPICISADPANPTCELDEIMKLGISLTASIKLPSPTCSSITLGIASVRLSVYRALYEDNDNVVTITSTTQNIYAL